MSLNHLSQNWGQVQFTQNTLSYTEHKPIKTRPEESACANRLAVVLSNRLPHRGEPEILLPTPPPNFDWFDLVEYYAFRLTLLISFIYTLYDVLKRKLKG